MLIIDFIKLVFLAFYYCVINIPLDLQQSKLLKIINYLNIFYWFRFKQDPGIRINAYLESMGPMFIKFGQLLSTRTDVVPLHIAEHLQHLTEQCRPFSGNKAKKIIEKSMNGNFYKYFKEFNITPIASASLAQVHEAVLKDNEQEIVIKVLRPNIEKDVKRNLNLLSLLANLAKIIIKDSHRLKIAEVVQDYKNTLNKETDLRLEASNTIRTRRNFENSELLYIPRVYTDFTSKNILVMEKIYGIPCTNIKEIEKSGVNLKKLAENGVEIFLNQVFRDNFFHADMHPGNIFVDAKYPEKNRYTAVDCAIVGSLSDKDLYNLGRMLSTTIKQDYSKLAKLFINAGWVNQDTNENELELTLRACCEPIFEKPLSQIEFGKLLLFLFDSTRIYGLSVQPSLILLQKTLIHIEGMGRQIYPELDFWSIAEPYIDNWIMEKYHPSKIVKLIKEDKLDILEKASEIPNEIFEILDGLKDLSNNRINQSKMQHFEDKLRKQQTFSRISFSIIFIIFIIFIVNF